MEMMLDPDKLQQLTIAGTVVEFDETLAGGKRPQSGMLSLKSSGAKKADRKGKAGKGEVGSRLIQTTNVYERKATNLSVSLFATTGDSVCDYFLGNFLHFCCIKCWRREIF